MTRIFQTVLLLLAAVAFGGAGCSSAQPAESQEKFGVRMARMNLWREALFRFNRAVEITPGDARAHSNLAVAYEANGDFEKAAKHYREAMRLDKTNPFIQKNYSRYVEFTSRSKKRQQQKRGDAARTVAATPGGTAAATPVAVADPAAAPAPPAPPAPMPVVAEPQPQPPQQPPGDRS